MRHPPSPSRLQRLLPAALVALCPVAADAASYLIAGVSTPIWGVPEYSCGSTSTGPTPVPVSGVSQSCTHDYTTVQQKPASIQLHSAAAATWDRIQMQTMGHWTGLAAPDFTGGGWGVTAIVDSVAGGTSRIEGLVINTGDQPVVFTMAAAMYLRGTMYFDTATSPQDVIQFPWGGQVRGDLMITLDGRGGGCTLFANANQADLATFVPPNGFRYDLGSDVGVTVTVPAHGSSVLEFTLSGLGDAASNPSNVVNAAVGDYGVDLDFYHTMGATNFRFTIDGVPVDPGSIPFQSDARVMFTASGIVPVPEPASALLFGEGALALFGAACLGRRRRRRRPAVA